LPTEIANLHDLEAFIKLPGPYPICKTKLTYKNLPSLTESFRPIPEIELIKRQQKLESFTLTHQTKQATHEEKAK
ncbi:MAG: hypothetical protein JNJ47_02090, partial [Alphaproteobacteria bacterium]|nr:hypothetical protein [Alphaproteobacteria bacterium]